MQDLFVPPSGQDDNLGDSALRVGLLRALRKPGRRFHIYLEGQSSDYVSGLPLLHSDVRYGTRRSWLAAHRKVTRPVYLLNAGEINPKAGQEFPHPARANELRANAARRGKVLAVGIGLKDPSVAGEVKFAPELQDAALVSWRDEGSRDAAGFGVFAPDWAFALGADPASWKPADQRKTIAVTLRFDRPLPPPEWFQEVRRLADATSTEIVTVAQVARDAPLAVRLARELGGQYLVAPSNSHDHLDRHVRAVYGNALAVVSDRAHGLIMGATEGAYPLGTAADPQKIQRLLDTARMGALTGNHTDFAERGARLVDELGALAPAVHQARQDLESLTALIDTTISS